MASTSANSINASTVDGVILTSTSGVPTVLANGTPGQVLTAQSGAPPAWANIAGGTPGLVLISTTSLTSGNSLAFTSLGSYTNYRLVINNLSTTSGADQLLLQFSVNGGSSYLSANMQFGLNTYAFNSATGTNSNSTTACLLSTSINLDLSNYCAIVDILNTGISNEGCTVLGEYCSQPGSSSFGKIYGQSSLTSANNNVNAFQLKISVETFSSGVVTLYGYAV